jgi:phytoene dehydrogenase-like protein
MNKVDTIVVGGGIAGLTATSFLAKEKRSVILFEKIFYFGGLVNSFVIDEHTFDGGLRSIENSGIVFPMLKQLGIDLEFVKSHVSLVVGDSVLRLSGNESIDEYQDFLIGAFPEEEAAVRRIIKEVKKITKYMDVMYGIDNPMFMDLKNDRDYLFKELLPWLLKFILTVRKIEKLNEPIYPYLSRFTDNQALIDNIAQHFFKDTPTSFALSYFSLYNDYNYPVGGTNQLPKALEKFSRDNGADLRLETAIVKVDPEEKYVLDDKGKKYYYNSLIWACDLKTLYRLIDAKKIRNGKLKKKVLKRREELKGPVGAESVYTVYMTIRKDPSYFREVATEHCFFTPDKSGLSLVKYDDQDKASIKAYLENYIKFNTLEISIPVLRDASLSPEGETGLEVSVLFDYELTKKIVEQGWKEEFKNYMEELMIRELIKLYPEMEGKVIKKFSSTPLTIERYTSNTQGAIIGWSFANPRIPVIHKFSGVGKSVNTPVRDIYKAGQWSYSPAGVPISILTGKLAANKALKKKAK